jgi:hypothetical protein
MQGQYVLTLIVHVSNGLAHHLDQRTPSRELSLVDSGALNELGITQEDALTLAKEWLTPIVNHRPCQ